MTTESSTTNYAAPAYGESPHEGSSTKEVAKDQAAGVAGSAKDAGQHVAGVAKEEAGNVAAEATRQARDLLGQTRAEISQQAADQQQRVAGGLRSLGTELGSMAESSDESGVGADLARQASGKAHELADWLEQRDPGSLLDEVKTFARRRPGTFLAIAVGAGLVAGRLTRSLKDESANAPGADRSNGSNPSYRTTDSSSPAPGYATPTAGSSTPPAAYGTTTGSSTPATGYSTPPATGYGTAGAQTAAPGATQYSPMDQYTTTGEYGTEPAAPVEVVVEPVVPPTPVARTDPEAGFPVNEDGRP